MEVTGFNANTTLGTLSTSTALTKSGNGNLIFAVAPPVGTTIASNGGLVVSMATGGSDPLVSTPLTFNGGGFGLSSAGGDATFNNAVSSSTNLTIAAGSFGNSNFAPTSVTFAPASLVAPAGNALTLRVNDQNYTLNVTPQITGTGNVVTEEGTVNLNGGVSNVGGNFTNRIANVTVNGNVSTNALLQEGNFNALGNNLVTGQLYGGSTTVTGTLNATSITTAGGTLNTNGTTTTSTVSVTGGAFNGNAALNVSGALAVSGGTASTNGALSAGSVLVNGTGTLNVKNNAIVAGSTTVDAGRTLNLDMGSGNTRTYSGAATIQNQGTLRATSGTTDFGSSAITVQPRTFTGGLIESMNDSAGNADNGFVLGQGRAGQPSTGGIKSGFRLGNDSTVNSTTAWGDNDLWVYTGQFYDADGQFSFAEHIDDQTRVRIDGTLVLSNDGWDVASNTNSATNNNGPGGPTPNVGNNYGMGPEGNGWHNIEVRMYNGGGGAGPSGGGTQGGGSNWNSGKGFVFSATGDSGLDANNFAILNDPGDSSVLRVVSGGGFITVEAGAKIAAGSTTGAQFLQLNGDGSPAVFQLNNNGSATASTVDNLRLSGAAPTGSVLLGDNNTFSVGRLVVVDGGALTLGKAAGAATGGVVKITGVVPGSPGTSTSSIGTGSVSVQGGTLLVNAPISGSGTVSASLSGTIGGNSNISGPVTANSGGAIAPGDIFGSGFELATLGTGSLTMNAGSSLKLDISDSLGYDSLNVTGILTLANANLEVAHLNFGGIVGDIFYLVNNDGIDAVNGTFLGLSDGDTYGGPNGSQYIISYDATTGGAFDGAGNDIALQLTVVPEPGTFSALLGGFGMLMGMQRFRRRKA